VEPSNRRLPRPALNDIKTEAREPVREARPPRKDVAPKKITPPDQTNAENFYYLKQMQSKTPMAIVLKDGEVLTGVIEWYDKCCLKLNREGAPNLLVYKSNVKYMHKA
jgi:host factor-I protein